MVRSSERRFSLPADHHRQTGAGVHRAGNPESQVQDRRRTRGYEGVMGGHGRGATRVGAGASVTGGGSKSAALKREPQSKLDLPRGLRRKNLAEGQRLIGKRVRQIEIRTV